MERIYDPVAYDHGMLTEAMRQLERSSHGAASSYEERIRREEEYVESLLRAHDYERLALSATRLAAFKAGLDEAKRTVGLVDLYRRSRSEALGDDEQRTGA